MTARLLEFGGLVMGAGRPWVPSLKDLQPFAAEAWIVIGLAVVLIVPFFVQKSNIPAALATLACLAAGLISTLLAGARPASAQILPMLVSDGPSFLWKIVLLVFAIGIVLMWFGTTRASVREGDGPEFFVLLLGATLGMALMASAANLLMLFMAVEMASLPSYLLAGFRKMQGTGAEAAMKYVLYGTTSTAVMLYGLSILYGLCGTLSLYSVHSAAGEASGVATRVASVASGQGALLAVALLALLVGIAFKVAAVPFHLWCPDVFEGAGVDVAAFLSVASKGAGLMLLLRWLSALVQAFPAGSGWTGAMAAVVGVLGAATMTVGNLGALAQQNMKRLLAYSSIAQAGYILCAVAIVGREQQATGAVSTVVIYLWAYLFMNLGAFTVVGVVGRQSSSDDISAFAGLGRRAPALAAWMAVFLLSLIGLPPLGGFIAKLNVFYLLAHAGRGWWILAVFLGANTVLSAAYYARVLRAMYLAQSDAVTFEGLNTGTVIAGVCAAALVLMLFCFAPLGRRVGANAKLFAPAPTAVDVAAER